MLAGSGGTGEAVLGCNFELIPMLQGDPDIGEVHGFRDGFDDSRQDCFGGERSAKALAKFGHNRIRVAPFAKNEAANPIR